MDFIRGWSVSLKEANDTDVLTSNVSIIQLRNISSSNRISIDNCFPIDKLVIRSLEVVVFQSLVTDH